MDDPAAELQAAREAVEAISGHVGQLGVSLALWGARDDDKPCPEARRAANVAMDSIDGALAGLHALRRSLVSEIRASDDATAARVDELLARGRTGST